MNLPQNPTGIDFIRFMESVWERSDETIYQLCHNARKTVRLIGAKRTGGTKLGGEPATIFQLPCGDKVRIADHGGAIELGR